MNLFFCLAGFFLPILFGASAEYNDNLVTKDSGSSTIGDSGTYYNASRDGKNNGQASYTYHPRNLVKRLINRATACHIPLELHDSEVKCMSYTDKLVCKHTCQFGHTFSEGIERTMECIFREDKWTPVPQFENCKPFVDCTFEMISPGGSTCQNSFYSGPTCHIYCDPYEDKGRKKPSKYWCEIDGQWTPDLPFCAAPGTGLDIVPPPSGRKTIFDVLEKSASKL